MEGLNKLWDYQTAELAFEEYENKLKNTPTRKQLVKLQRYLQNSQKLLAESENTSRIKQDKLTNYEARLKKCDIALEELGKDLSYYTESDITEVTQQEVTDLVKGYERVNEAITSLTRSITKIKTEVDDSTKETRELMQKMKKAKLEFDTLKETHKKELESDSGELEKLKAELANAERQVDAGLLETYKRIKKNKPNPVAILNGVTCSGCKMQLPSGFASNVKNSDSPVYCENCNRILYIPKDSEE